jgi:hypothetical protein
VERNPYAAPSTESGDARPTGDDVDLYMATLPSDRVRAAGISSLVAGVSTLLMAVQTAMVHARSTTGMALAGILVALAFAFFGTARGIANGKLVWLIVGIATGLATGLCSLVVLLAVSFVGMVGGLVVFVTITLLALSFGEVQKMSRARRQLRASEARVQPDAVRRQSTDSSM